MRRPRSLLRTPALLGPALVGSLLLAGCVSDADAEPDVSVLTATTTDQFPDVVDVVAEFDAERQVWSFSVTMSSPYDTPARYADGWRVVGPDGEVYGVHTLTHDHAGEQPFTRRQTGVQIPGDVAEVTIEGRDQEHGFGGGTVTISLHTG